MSGFLIGLGLGGRAGVAAWTPAALGSSVAAWWDASDASTITFNGSNVSAWASKVGGITASQATAANQPAYSATARNGRPGVTNNAAKTLEFSTLLGLPMGASDGTMVAVAYGLSAGTDRQLMGYGNSTAGNGRYVFHDTNAAMGVSGAGSNLASSTSLVLFDRLIVGGIAGSTKQLNLSVDGTLISGTATPTVNTTGSTGALFRWPAFGSPFQGTLQETLILNRALTTDERQKLEGYLAWKWGLTANLPAGHPYKNAAPTI